MLVMDTVKKVYENGPRAVAAVKGVSLTIESGDFVALMGPSGCGKSTLLHLIGGMDRPTGGRIIFDQVPFDRLSEEELARFRRRRIGFVFQFFNLLPTLTVAENIALPLWLDGGAEAAAEARTRRLLERVGLAERAAHFPAELSGGEMQRAAVARAVVHTPPLVLADEPTGNLDSENGRQVMTLLAELNRELGHTIIVATHSPEVAQYARRTLHMRDGLIERISPHESVPQTF